MDLKGLNRCIKERDTIFYASLASMFISISWRSYIFAVNSGRVVETSLGYYINPLMLLAMWVFIFKESLDKLQVFSLSLAYIGVFLLTLMYGHFPWLSVVIALSLGVFIYRKEFNKTYAVSFAFIWLALTVYSAGLFRKARQKHHAVQRVS